ncbi:hypothetical protein [Streptomyces sp. NPDC013740]|uniref:hypothetical protein n=1 Tax=Streptomyces sp. NPDC013740 TaxID=3364867 RepID=UPI0036F88D7A
MSSPRPAAPAAPSAVVFREVRLLRARSAQGECVPQAVVDVPRRELVVRAGRVVARDGALL